MKIVDIKTYPVWVGRRNQMLVKVETDEGIYGWGEAGVSSREKAVEAAVLHYREFLVGKDPMSRGGAVATHVPQPVLRGRANPDRRHLGHRHSVARHSREEARRAGLPASRRKTAELRPMLRHGRR